MDWKKWNLKKWTGKKNLKSWIVKMESEKLDWKKI